MWNHFRSRINHVYVHFNLWEMIPQSRVPSVIIMPLFTSVVSQPHTHMIIFYYLCGYPSSEADVYDPIPFCTIYLISCSVVYESTMYSNLIKVLTSISPYWWIFPPFFSPNIHLEMKNNIVWVPLSSSYWMTHLEL